MDVRLRIGGASLGLWLGLLTTSAAFATGPRLFPATCPGYLSALGQNLKPEDYAFIDLQRATNAKLVYVNHELLKQDFPFLRDMTDEQRAGWVRQNLAYVTQYVNDNQGVQHSGIAVDPKDRARSMVPHTYGRADVMGTDQWAVDRKMIGVTYVTKTPDGKVILNPGRVQFKPGVDHQNGLGKGWEAIYEITAGEILQAATAEPNRPTGANQIYASFDLNAQIYNHTPEGNLTSSDPAYLVARQLNVRFYRLPKDEAAEGREDFLYSNARLFWRGLYHGSLNRYNADKGVYLDYGTVTGVPRDAYRLTAMSHVPYGLSDFYGFFGEWSAGQAAGKGDKNESPFHHRSWGVFLANVAVGMGMDKAQTLKFVKENEALLGATDLHELLLQMNSRRRPAFRSDPTQKTYTKMDLVTITDSGEQIPDPLKGLIDTADIYRALLKNATSRSPSPPGTYEALLKRASHDVEEAPLKELANRLHQVEGMVRDQLAWRPGVEVDSVGANRVGEQFLRARLMRDAVDAQQRAASGHPEAIQEMVDRYRRRLLSAAPEEILKERPGGHDSAAMGRYLEAFLRSGRASGSQVRIRTDHIDRELPFLTGNVEMLKSPEYAHLRDNTVGLIWRDTRAAGEQYGHSYIRIGDKIFDLQIANIFGDDFTRMMQNRFFYNFGMRGRPGSSPYHEVLYSVSPEAKAALLKFYEDRQQGRATVGGQPVVPYFDVSGKGDPWGDGIVRENCGAFATCFNHPRWKQDYPGLEQAVKDTGLSERRDGAVVGLQSLFDPKTKPIGMISWGGQGDGHDLLGFTGAPHRAEVLQGFGRQAPNARYRKEADDVRSWALANGLGGFQATAYPSVSKSGELSGSSQRFNLVRLAPEKIPSFKDAVAKDSLVFWWRWEPSGFGHVWVSIKGQIYDLAAGGYQMKDLAAFFAEEQQRGFHLNGAETFFVGVQMKMEPAELDALETFFTARVRGRKADGTPVAQPGYVWDAPFVKDQATSGRCGMFATSCGNRAWQDMFPELPLNQITEKYGLRYMDGSLFTLHKAFHSVRTSKNLFVVGPPRHMTPDPNWNLPTDSLPDDVRETLRGAWSVGEREPFGR